MRSGCAAVAAILAGGFTSQKFGPNPRRAGGYFAFGLIRPSRPDQGAQLQAQNGTAGRQMKD